jgi:hypothetical protein
MKLPSYQTPKRKCPLRLPNIPQMQQPIPPLLSRRHSPNWHPPQRHVRYFHLLKPARPIPKDLHMSRFIGKVFQVFDTFPNRHIDDDQWIAEYIDAGGIIAGIIFQAPHKTGATFRQGIDVIELPDEVSNEWVIYGRE